MKLANCKDKGQFDVFFTYMTLQKEIKDRKATAITTRNRLHERRMQSARSRHYYDDYQVRMRAKMMKRRTKEETVSTDFNIQCINASCKYVILFCKKAVFHLSSWNFKKIDFRGCPALTSLKQGIQTYYGNVDRDYSLRILLFTVLLFNTFCGGI